MTNSALSQLTPAYTKQLVHNRNDTVWQNMERALEECPMVKAAPDLLTALKRGEEIARCHGYGRTADEFLKVINQAEGK